VQRFDQRQGFLVSAAVHLTLLMILIAHPPVSPRKVEDVDPATLERKDRVFLPPNSVLKQIIPLAPRAARPTPPPNAVAQARPVPTPPPPAPQGKDRISVGPPSELRRKGPMMLERDQDLTKVAKGVPDPQRPTPAPPPPPAPRPASPPAPEPSAAREARSEVVGREGLRLPPGLLGAAPSGDEGRRGREGRPETRSIPGENDQDRTGTSIDRSARAAIDQMARRLRQDAQLGIPTGSGKDLGGLYFDPQGADFTLWIQRFKDEAYRNWIVPQAVFLGFRGHVDIQFTVERDGTVSSLRVLKSSGTASLDRAAANALTSGRFLPLPDDYRPPRVTVNITFFYDEGPQGS
jgi:TonB family protein